MQMLQLLDGSEDSPLPDRKQETPPVTLWIDRAMLPPASSELRRRPSSS
ncbi:MAG: hypothetical protein QOG37_690 [Mycobacterium sp.]|jgi:hypothetical protein|nr:hypothetical protein [Mycobacterium sp.]